MPWGRALLIGLGLSLLWSDQDLLSLRPTFYPSQLPPQGRLAQPGLAELLNTSHGLVSAATLAGSRSQQPSLRALGMEMAERYQGMIRSLGSLTAAPGNGADHPPHDHVVNPAFGSPLEQERMLLTILSSSVDAAIQSCQSQTVAQWDTELSRIAKAVLPMLTADQRRLQALSRDLPSSHFFGG